MASALNAETIRSSVLGTVNRLGEDSVPNIRFNVAKCLDVLAARLHEEPEGAQLVSEGILPSLERLQSDSDADVRFFANKGLAVRALTLPWLSRFEPRILPKTNLADRTFLS